MAIRRTRAISRPEVQEYQRGNLTEENRWNQQLFDQVHDARSIFYSGVDPRRRQEMADSAMVQEDNRQVANLSDRFIHEEFPRQGFYANPYIDAIEQD